MKTLLAMIVVVALVEPSSAQREAAQRESAPADVERARVVYVPRHLQAVDLANTVNTALLQESNVSTSTNRKVVRAAIVPEQLGNSVIVSAPKEGIERVLDLVKTLDQKQRMVAIDVLLVEVASVTQKERPELPASSDQTITQLVEQLRSRPGLRILDRCQVNVLGGHSVQFSLGGRVPQIRESRTVARGGQANSVALEDVGITLGLATRVNPDGLVAVAIDFEKSHLGPKEDGVVVAAPKNGEVLKTSPVRTVKTETTLSLARGRTTVVGGMIVSRASGPVELVLIASGGMVP